MEHSIRFGKTIQDLFTLAPDINVSPMGTDHRHSYTDWYLIPKERYSIEPPEVKSNIIEIPAADGGLDLSESLTGYPIYSNREGTMEFYVDDEKLIRDYFSGTDTPSPHYDNLYMTWYDIYRDICQFLNGRVMYMLLEDDSRWVYRGRFTVGKYESGNGHFSEIKISYVLDPYKLLPWRNDGNYYWDALTVHDLPGALVPQGDYIDKDSLINFYNDIPFNGESVTLEFRSGLMPTIPRMIFKLKCDEPTDKPSVTMTYTNETINRTVSAKTYTVSDDAVAEEVTINGTQVLIKTLEVYDRTIVFVDRLHPSFTSHAIANAVNKLTLSGVGWLSIDYEIGVL